MTRVGVAAESMGDLSWVCGLADGILCHDIKWVESELIDSYRTWCGHDGRTWMDLHRASDEARAKGLRCYGHFEGEPGAVDAHMFRAIFLLFWNEDVQPDVVVVSRDADGDDERVHGFNQAARGLSVLGAIRRWPFSIVGAIARPELEAWLIASFSPRTAEEEDALATVRQRIGFDPRLHPERLTSKKPQDKKDAKRVLDEISGEDQDRVKESWASAPLDDLIERGKACGLADYIGDVRSTLVPAVAGTAPGTV
jgi:hypothetical protein